MEAFISAAEFNHTLVFYGVFDAAKNSSANIS